MFIYTYLEHYLIKYENVFKREYNNKTKKKKRLLKMTN